MKNNNTNNNNTNNSANHNTLTHPPNNHTEKAKWIKRTSNNDTTRLENPFFSGDWKQSSYTHQNRYLWEAVGMESMSVGVIALFFVFINLSLLHIVGRTTEGWGK